MVKYTANVTVELTDEEGFTTKKKIEQVQIFVKESEPAPSTKELFTMALNGAIKDMKTVAHKTLEKFDVSPKKLDFSGKDEKPVAEKKPAPAKVTEIKAGQKVDK